MFCKSMFQSPLIFSSTKLVPVDGALNSHNKKVSPVTLSTGYTSPPLVWETLEGGGDISSIVTAFLVIHKPLSPLPPKNLNIKRNKSLVVADVTADGMPCISASTVYCKYQKWIINKC